MRLTGNTIAITGGGSGIGRALAVALHEAGNRVIVAGRRDELLRDLADAHPGIEAIPLDLTDHRSRRRFVEQVEQRYPDLNVLINNAAVMPIETPGPDAALVERTVATNLTGPLVLTALLLPLLRRRAPGAIVNVTSALAFVPRPQLATYSATKAALHSYTDSLRLLLRDSGLRVIEVVPPRVDVGAGIAGDSSVMSLEDFVAAMLTGLAESADEIVVGPATRLRYAERRGEYTAALSAMDVPALDPEKELS
jgi:uncharacterized oxidoreductase